MKPPNWLGNKEGKIIEQRKLEIEDFIHALLVSDTMFNMEKNLQTKYLSLLSLEPNFYEQPQLLCDIE